MRLDFENKMKLAQTILSKLRGSDLFVINGWLKVCSSVGAAYSVGGYNRIYGSGNFFRRVSYKDSAPATLGIGLGTELTK